MTVVVYRRIKASSCWTGDAYRQGDCRLAYSVIAENSRAPFEHYRSLPHIVHQQLIEFHLFIPQRRDEHMAAVPALATMACLNFFH